MLYYPHSTIHLLTITYGMIFPIFKQMFVRQSSVKGNWKIQRLLLNSFLDMICSVHE